ncbi:MAG TPA: histidinol dehydrogenase [Candidatus Dormibacteraeota bacterium]
MPIKRYRVGDWLDSPLSRRRLDLSELRAERAVVEEIVGRVAAEGDPALREFGRRFDGWAPAEGEPFAVGPAALEAARRRLPAGEREALELAARRIRDFHDSQAFTDVAGPPGMKLLTRPVRRAGLYVPGGRAAYPSTVLMTAIPARVAGVRELVVCTPPAADGGVPTAILAAAAIAGVDDVYRVGGAQAIAALAYGTASIPRVDFIAGPGNLYVTLAKKEVFGVVGVDAIAGPTEIMVVADGRARADFVAADLASQMEHDPLAWAVLVTDSAALADAVEEEFSGLLQRLDRAEVIAAAHLAVILADDLEQAFQVVNDFGPEHLEILAADPARWLPLVENAGAVFLGDYAAVTLGDYVIGPNHTLPTSGSARFASPLGVYSFLKRTSVSSVTRGDLQGLQEAARTLARMEGLTAHANAVEVRLHDE